MKSILISLLNKGKYELIFSNDELVSLVNTINKYLEMAKSVPLYEKQLSICEIIDAKSYRHYKYGELAGRLLAYYDHERLREIPMHSRLANAEENRTVREGLIDKIKKSKISINYDNDYMFSYFSYRMFQNTYIQKVNGIPCMTPQDVYYGIAHSLWDEDAEIQEEYEYLSAQRFTFPTPTLANAMYDKFQLSSCFLLSVNDDSINGMYRNVIGEIADISASAGGMSLDVSCLRSSGSKIKGSGGVTTGLVSYLKPLEQVMAHVMQGGTRKGALAIYTSEWHADFLEFLEAGNKHGAREKTVPGLNFGQWMTDLFLKRVRDDGVWSFFNPQTAPGLRDVYGKEFDTLYLKYESEKLYTSQMSARELVYLICKTTIAQGNRNIMAKDVVNKTANHAELGTIVQSNLCDEVNQFVGVDKWGRVNTPVCTLASISLPYHVRNGIVDTALLGETVRHIVRSLNRIIRIQRYPTETTRQTALRNAAMGIGIQGLSDVFQMLERSHTSEEARHINALVQETIYYYALDESCNLVLQYGKYEWFEISKHKKGILHFDYYKPVYGFHYDWDTLRKKVKFGVANSTLLANMPTATTSSILGNVECFEPPTYNIMVRQFTKGEFKIINKHLVNYMEKRGLWNDTIADMLITSGGSVMDMECLTDNEKQIFRTAYEIDQLDLMEMDADRQAFVDQAQSSNRFVNECTSEYFFKMLFKARELKLKTLFYYFHSSAVKKTNTPVPMSKSSEMNKKLTVSNEVCAIGCQSCGS